MSVVVLQEENDAGSAGPVNVHVLLDFLRLMHSNKEAEASHIKQHLNIIDQDIQQVAYYYFTLK